MDPKQQLEQEEERIVVMQVLEGRWKETRWAKYLEVKEMEDTPMEKETWGIEWYTTRQEQAEIREEVQWDKQKKEKEEKQRKDAEEEALLTKVRQEAKRKGAQREIPERSSRERREKKDKEDAE
jgi:hypothetical protein